MTKVIGVRFRTAGKIYFFSPGEFEIKQGDHVIVETARGIEYGRVVSAPKEVDDDSVIQPLKSVIRIATEQDEKTVEKNRQKEKEAFKICQEKIRKQASLRQALEASTILTNATSLGMAPHADTCPIPDASMLRPELIVSDIIYNPKQTRLLQMASANGCATFNGLYMLLFQGAEAFRLWTGKEMPIEPIREHYFKG